MKVCVVQPPYSFDFADSQKNFEWEMEAFDRCDESMDIIVFPEYTNVPAKASTQAEMEQSYRLYGEALTIKAKETARRCGATVFMCCVCATETGLRNGICAFDKQGNEVGRYYKQHLVNSEMHTFKLESEYTYEYEQPTILEIDGIRYAFLICYDFYFYENFANIARYNPDVLIACSHQRSDPHHVLEMLTTFCAYNTNAYVLRSSVSLGADSAVGGSSMIVTPEGKVLANLKNEVGFATAEIDPHARYLKAAGFGNPPDVHHNYIEAGRRPWKYRPGGSAIVRHDSVMPYPRLCAHRGFNTVAPENSLAAFGAAVALGAPEIEFDLWAAKDGTIVSMHDRTLERVSDGTGYVWDYTYEELLQFDFGKGFDGAYEGIRVLRFEDILKKFACHTVMNVHIKSVGNDATPLPQSTIDAIVGLIRQYDCVKYCYFMSGNPAILQQLRDAAPEIPRCAGASEVVGPDEDLVEKALAFGCDRIQLYKPYFPADADSYLTAAVEKAHANGIRCNIFWSDDPSETRHYLELGIDTVLTNDYQRNRLALEAFMEMKNG
ncbi:MAG: hypothetical protein IJO76_07630 [Clostridia bacterium]|nr:hypothetical protein [Clostridia bacterium]